MKGYSYMPAASAFYERPMHKESMPRKDTLRKINLCLSCTKEPCTGTCDIANRIGKFESEPVATIEIVIDSYTNNVVKATYTGPSGKEIDIAKYIHKV